MDGPALVERGEVELAHVREFGVREREEGSHGEPEGADGDGVPDGGPADVCGQKLRGLGGEASLNQGIVAGALGGTV